MRRSRLAAFGRYHDHTAGSLRSVNCGSGSVLQHGDRLDVVRIDPTDARSKNIRKVSGANLRVGNRRCRDLLLHRYAVNDPQRFGIARDGARSANADLHGFARTAGYGLHAHSGQFALQQFVYSLQRRSLEIFSFNHGNRTGAFTNLSFGKACHDDLSDVRGLLLERYIITDPIRLYLEFLRFITNV